MCNGKGALKAARWLHVFRRPCQTSRSLSLFCWVAPLWGLGPFLSLLRLAPAVELGRSCQASGSVLEGVAAFTGR